jgi:hypothetical protein
MRLREKLDWKGLRALCAKLNYAQGRGRNKMSLVEWNMKGRLCFCLCSGTVERDA